jgi:hypothetical protein
MTTSTYILEILALEDTVEHVCGPFRVLVGKGRVPSVEKVELDGDNVAFADWFEIVVLVSDVLSR